MSLIVFIVFLALEGLDRRRLRPPRAARQGPDDDPADDRGRPRRLVRRRASSSTRSRAAARCPASSPSLVFSVLIVYFIRRRRGGGLIDPGVPDSRDRDARGPHGGEQPLDVVLVVVVHEAGADGAVRGEAEEALELPGVVVAVPDRDLVLGQRARRPRRRCGPSTLNISVGVRSRGVAVERHAVDRARPVERAVPAARPRARARRPSPCRACSRPRRRRRPAPRTAASRAPSGPGRSSGDGRELVRAQLLEQLRARRTGCRRAGRTTCRPSRRARRRRARRGRCGRCGAACTAST